MWRLKRVVLKANKIVHIFNSLPVLSSVLYLFDTCNCRYRFFVHRTRAVSTCYDHCEWRLACGCEQSSSCEWPESLSSPIWSRPPVIITPVCLVKRLVLWIFYNIEHSSNGFQNSNEIIFYNISKPVLTNKL